MARKTAQQAADKWAQRVSQSDTYYRNGVQTTTKDWAAASVAAADRRNAALIDAINSGRIDAGIQKAGAANKWRANTLAKAANWTAGVSKAKPAYQSAMQQNQNYMAAADAAVSGIGTTTINDRLERARVWALTMHEQAQAQKGAP